MLDVLSTIEYDPRLLRFFCFVSVVVDEWQNEQRVWLGFESFILNEELTCNVYYSLEQFHSSTEDYLRHRVISHHLFNL